VLSLVVAIVGGVFIIWLVLVMLFTPHIPYHIEADVDADSDHFVQVLESTLQVTMTRGNRVDVFTNGERFYPAMLETIRAATETVNLECYIFKPGKIGDAFVAALADRARQGIRVTIVVDAIGSLGTYHRISRPLREAGCRIERYQRLSWYRLARLNNRTHRELLVVDGLVAFAGGAGVADWWAMPQGRKPAWRDMMLRFEGPVVSNIQGIIAENWLECCGEILTGPETYKARQPVGQSAALSLKSSPSDRATSSRVLIQTLIEGANRRVCVSTPYFLPDKAFRRAFIRTARRGVEVRVIVPGSTTDQRWVRLASRRMWGSLLEAGVRIYEYRPGMTHVKCLLVDDVWAVVGTTNIDNRSFEHNDEVNVVVRDRAVADRLRQDFSDDLKKSVEVERADWERRPVWEKLLGSVAWILERQQ
jgi:cardiolipin synthase A/B